MTSFPSIARLPFLVGGLILGVIGIAWVLPSLALAAPTPQVPWNSEGGSEAPETRPAYGVDVVLDRIDLAGKSQESVGADVVNDDARETLQLAMVPSQTQNFLVHIKNTGRNTASFNVGLGSPSSEQKAMAAWKSKGWSCFIAVDGSTNNLLEALQSKDGWATPQLTPGAETVLRLSVTTTADTTQLDYEGSFRLVAAQEGASDAVVGELGVQYIARVEWSVNMTDWQPVNNSVHVPQLQGVLLRAVRANPKIAWHDFLEFLPTWDYQESWKARPSHQIGEMISLDPGEGGTINFTATGGNKVSGQVVLPTEED